MVVQMSKHLMVGHCSVAAQETTNKTESIECNVLQNNLEMLKWLIDIPIIKFITPLQRSDIHI